MVDNPEDPQLETYDYFISSTASAIPQDYFEFNSATDYYYYTSNQFKGQFNGHDWLPVAISFSTIRQGPNEASDYSLQITLPTDSELVRDHGRLSSSATISVKIHRTYKGLFDQDAKIIWRGRVSRVQINEDKTVLVVPNNLTHFMKQDIPRVYYQSICNHVLYDRGCGVIKSNFEYKATVDSTSGLDVRMVALAVSDGELVGGSLFLERTQESRMIVKNSGSDIKINYPLASLEAGDNCILYSGCDHSIETCKNKFNNFERFGGHLSIPPDNPFMGDID